MGIHDGHRARKKAQFLEHGLDAFSDYEALELLLYYAIPRGDVNPIAHALLDRFGSLDAVLSATVCELQAIEGVGDVAASLISLVLPLARRAETISTRIPAILGSTEQAGVFFCKLFFGMRDERLYMACIDAKGKLLRCSLVAEGSVDTASINLRRVVEVAFQCNATSVYLAHNHPSGLALPSSDDNRVTLMAQEALYRIGVTLSDHLIVADGDYVSLRDNGILP